MNKRFLFCLSSLLMFLMGSCTSEDLNNEVSEVNIKKTSRSITNKTAGDGIYDVLGHGYNVAGEYANASAAGFKVIDIDRFKSEQNARLIMENTYSQEYVEEYGENAEAYSRMVSTKVDVTANVPLFKKNTFSSF